MRRAPFSPVQCRRGGFALLLIMIVLAFTTAMAVLFFANVGRERRGVDLYTRGSEARSMADTAVNLVMGQVNAATKESTVALGPEAISWASQPGMIRTYKGNGALSNAYKLYSWDRMVESGASGFDPNDEKSQLPPATWGSAPAIYTDINQPVNGIYPVVDPSVSLKDPSSQFDPFTISSSYPSGSPAPPTADTKAPMPVKWLYVLRDGSCVSPTSGTGGNTATVGTASETNPIVGRIAFWTDDETSKVNINTASEGAYWDWPKAASADELQFAGNPPVKNEFNRTPGHPATTSLSAVFPETRQGTFNRWSDTVTYARQLQDVLGIVPRIDWSKGGSRGGTWPINSYSASYSPTYGSWISLTAYSPITLDANRLYATSDDLWFKPDRSSNSFGNYGLTPKDFSRRLFFLTACSRAPETTLFETPRISLWPITYPYLSSFWSDFSTNATIKPAGIGGRRATAKPKSIPSPDSTVNPLSTLAEIKPYPYITPQEALIGFCSTLDSAETASHTPNLYYFQRQNPDSPTKDWSDIKRNRQLVTYLRNEMQQDIPGVGSSLAEKWDTGTAGNADWIALNCFDFSRSLLNQYTFDPNSTNGNLLYSYTGVGLRQGNVGGASVAVYDEPNTAAVVPLHVGLNGNTYITEGAYPALKEAAVLFYATSRVEPVPPKTGSGGIDGNRVPYAGEWQSLITYSPGSATGKSRTTTMRAVMLFSFSQMTPGHPRFSPIFWIKVTPVNGASFSVNGNSINLPSTNHNSIQWSTLANGFFTSQNFAPLFYKQYNQPKIFSNTPPTTPSNPGTLSASSPSYYTLISDPITVDPDAISFSFTGTPVRVDIYAPYSSNLDIDPTADPKQLISSQEIDFRGWNRTLRTPLAPRWCVSQKGMTLAGSAPNRTYVSGPPMPDPANPAEPVAVNPTPPSPPQGWQAEVVPQIDAFRNTTGLLSVDNLSIRLPLYNISGTGSGTTNYGTSVNGLTPAGFVPYVYTGKVTAPVGSTAPTISYTPPLGNTGISTDIRCRVAGLAQRGGPPSGLTKYNFQFSAEGSGMDPFNVGISTNDVQGYTLITPYDSVISMVTDPTSSSAGDPRLMGRGIYSPAGSTRFIPIDTALTGNSPNHVIGINSSNTAVTTSGKYSVFPPRSTDQQQFHQLGWPGSSGIVSTQSSNVPMNTGYLTVPTFGGGNNHMAIRGITAIPGILGNDDRPDTAVSVEANVTMSLNPNGDWTSMPGQFRDGGYVSRPDQDYQTLTQDFSAKTQQFVPYFQLYGNASTTTSSSGSSTTTSGDFFMPNRQVPSPVILGTLPSDMRTGWQTLAFCPNPAKTMNGAGTHPGLGVPTKPSATARPYTTAPDHLVLDLFWMPVAEPYPISDQFSTAGKINLNYAMMPFPYIHRKTGLDAVLKSVWLTALPASVANHYKSFYHMTTFHSSVHTRYPINVNESLKAFDYKFDQGDIFRSASQICDMFLYPNDPNTPNTPLVSGNSNGDTSAITAWWNTQQLTSDNGREEPYNAIYSRVTCKSNTFTVHWKVQVLRKAAGTTPTVWDENRDVVASELRGSRVIERYIDPNATNIPDYTTDANARPLGWYYKWRVVTEHYFQP